MNDEFRPKILLVTSDEESRNVLSIALERQGFIVSIGMNGDEAISLADKDKPDIIILDSNLPGLKGIEICTILSIKSNTKGVPVIMLSEREGEFDQVKGLEGGIEDYVVKPFVPNELVIRVKTILRRTKPVLTQKVLEYKELKMDMASYRVTRNGREVHLGPTEFKILQCLMEYPKRILSRQYIMSHVWGYESQVEPRTIDVHINRLRTALRNYNEDLPFIKTVRSAGYCLGGPGND